MYPESWTTALLNAETRFKQLQSSPCSEWKRVSTSSSRVKSRINTEPDVSDIVVDRNTTTDDVYRLVLDVPVPVPVQDSGSDSVMVSLEPWIAVLSTPETRQEWDPAVSESHLVEMVDQDTRIQKTNFTLGWPANPRDAVTISRTMYDATTVIDISTSLPRSADEPAYLRPSPPYVRSNVSILAWCIQHIHSPPKLRITCYSQHNLRTWNSFSGNTGTPTRLSTMLLGLVKTTNLRGGRVPRVLRYGDGDGDGDGGITIDKIKWDIDREALSVEYAVIPEPEPELERGLELGPELGLGPEDSGSGGDGDGDGDEEKRQEGQQDRNNSHSHPHPHSHSHSRSIEYLLPASEGWDVQLSTRASEEELENLGWDVSAVRKSSFSYSYADSHSYSNSDLGSGSHSGSRYTDTNSNLPSLPTLPPLPKDQILLRITHAPFPLPSSTESESRSRDHVLKVKVVIELSGSGSGTKGRGGSGLGRGKGGSGLRVNGVVERVDDILDDIQDQVRNHGQVRSMGQAHNLGQVQNHSLDQVRSTASASVHGSTSTSTSASSTSSSLPSTHTSKSTHTSTSTSTSTRTGRIGVEGRVGVGVGVGVEGRIGLGVEGRNQGGPAAAASAEKTILARVKRNYIYFSSLLQEPEAKWKRATESRGVTITQLDSIDPTLVVYRAEATFVGVGLWDLYSAVVCPGAGARNYPDKGYKGQGHEDGVLLEDINELTELWYLKTRGAWPVNGRDSVVLKTVYKSPTTIHVFSFSADDLSHLFPSSLIPGVPPPPNTSSSSSSSSSSFSSNPNPSSTYTSSSSGVIRTQIDLQGYAIEALSPTTTLLTLLEQSDVSKGKGGWVGVGVGTNPLPNAMIQSLAGIGEFVIKCGGPPVVTRLEGARKREVRYDHERMSFRVEYEPAGRMGMGMGMGRRVLNANAGNNDLNGNGSTNTHTSTPTPTSPVIECEIRCDTDTWASSLDIVVDPPPQSVSCLRRHRLSDEGGGLWITITHDAVFVDEERLQVIVRRGPGAGFGMDKDKEKDKEKDKDKDRGLLVMVNGAKTSVDVEELPEHEIKMLSRRKRVKPPRIPLDQPPVMGVIRRRRAEWDADASSDSPPAAEGGSSSSSTGTPSTLPKVSSPLARFFTYAVDQATATTQQTIAAISPSASALQGDDTILSSSKSPMHYALDALAWTQGYHFSSSTPHNAGWTLVSDKNGLAIRRKLASDVSPVVPVHKADKVIEGVSAEELAGVVNEWECRKRWDERFESAVALERFAGGCGTWFAVFKPGFFPFRDRGFYGATVVARAQGAPSVSRRDTGDGLGLGLGLGGGGGNGPGPGGDAGASGSGGGDAGNRTGGRNAIFCVSTSFSPDSVTRFAAAKYNPYGLPIGRMYIDAWILETLDPYTKENYAVPSTRCTRLVSVDYAGSLPAAVTSMINAALPRAILGVEAYVKGIVASLPITRLPPAGFVLADRKDDDVEAEVYAKMAWKLRRRDEYRTLVDHKWDPGSRVYTSLILVRYPTTGNGTGLGSGSGSAAASPTRRSNHHLLTPRASRVGLDNIYESGAGSQSSLDTLHGHAQSTTSGLLSPPSPTSPSSSSPSPSSPGQGPSTSSSSSILGAASTSSPSIAGAAMPGQRERTTSGSSGGFRGRSSSAFTIKGEVKHTADLVVGEVVIDSKHYEKGYVVTLKSRVRARTVGKTNSGDGLSRSHSQRDRDTVISLDSVFQSGKESREGDETSPPSSSSPPPPSPDTEFDPFPDSDSEYHLPLSYTIHTMPSSPLHSSGMNTENPTRHLLRLTLPTAQYQISTVRDPLTGEVQQAPERPGWLRALEGEGGEEGGMGVGVGVGGIAGAGVGGALVRVEVKPVEGAGVGKGKAIVIDGRGPPDQSRKEKSTSGKDGRTWNADKGGWEVTIVGEKESLTILGREELLDDRVSKMGVLSRATNETEPLPDDLKTPVAVADRLLDPSVTDFNHASAHQHDGTTADAGGAESSVGSESHSQNAEESIPRTNTPEGPGHETPGQSHSHTTHMPAGGNGRRASGGGLLNFLQSYPYPNPLTRFTTNGTLASMGVGVIKSSSEGENVSSKSDREQIDGAGGATAVLGPRNQNVNANSYANTNTKEPATGPGRLYPVSTLIIIALIAFLIGSLLRSLLSPADFIYVVKDVSEAEEAQIVHQGWREMKRLFEIKYILGGWDFQIAVVRRH